MLICVLEVSDSNLALGTSLPSWRFCDVLVQYLLTPWSRVLLEKLTGLQLVKISPHFMESEGSLPHSQVPATCPYPEPAWSSLHIPSHFLKIHFTIILPSTSGSLSLRFPRQNPVYASTPPIRATCPAHFILDFSTRTVVLVQYLRPFPKIFFSFSKNPDHFGPSPLPQQVGLSHRS